MSFPILYFTRRSRLRWGARAEEGIVTLTWHLEIKGIKALMILIALFPQYLKAVGRSKC